MMVYENDKLIIPKKYQEMSISELKKEKDKVLQEFQSQPRPKKKVTSNKKGIVFHF